MDTTVSQVAGFLAHVDQLNARYRAGGMRASVPDAMRDGGRSLEGLVEQHLPASHAALDAASQPAPSTSTSCSRRSGRSARALRTKPHSGARDSPAAPSSGPVATAPHVSHAAAVSFNRGSLRIACSSLSARSAPACAAARMASPQAGSAR